MTKPKPNANPHASAMAKIKSAKRSKAARMNGKKGGRPTNDDIILAKHLEYCVRNKADILNLGWSTGLNYICSKTTKGIICSTLIKGRASHEVSDQS